MSKAAEDTVPTFRGRYGDTITINTEELVVGDVIQLMQGNRIPCDCLLITSTDFAADESPLTGEPE